MTELIWACAIPVNIPIDDPYTLMASHLDLASGGQYHWQTSSSKVLVGSVANSVGTALDKCDPQTAKP